MKRVLLLFLCIALLGSMALAKGGKRFAYSPSTLNNPFFSVITDGLKSVIKANGDQLVVLDPQYDQAKQISQIEDLVAQKIDALFLIPVDAKGVKDALDSCKKANIPVINIDTEVFDRDLVATGIVSDNYLAGVLCGKDMAQKFPKGGKIAIIDFPVAQACIDRVNGFLEGLGSKRNLFKIVAQQDGKASLEASMPIAENILQGNPDLKAFFCINDPTALGTIAALKAAGKNGKIKVWGVDGSPDAKKILGSGDLEMTVAQSPINLGKTGAQKAYDILSGKKIEKHILVPTFAITPSNVKKYGTNGWQ